jgi:hypothetical protein
VVDEEVDFSDEFFDAFERASADCLLRYQSEPALDLVEPRGVCGCELKLVARPCCEPCAYIGVFVGGAVIEDRLYVEIGRHGLVNSFEKAEKLLMPVARLALGEHASGPSLVIQESRECHLSRGTSLK